MRPKRAIRPVIVDAHRSSCPANPHRSWRRGFVGALVVSMLAVPGAGVATSQEAPPAGPEVPTVMLVVDTSGSMAGSRLT